MSTTKTKTATVSVPPKATVNVTVRFKTNNAPVVGASAIAGNETIGQKNRNLGKTNGAGQLRNVKFEPGLVTIVLSFKNHRGEGMPQAFATNPGSTIIFQGTLSADEVRNIDVVMVQVVSQVTISVVDSVSGLPLGGTKITGSSEGNAGGNGQFVSGPLGLGVIHTFSATVQGFGPENGNVEGPVSTTLDLRNASSIANTTLPLRMRPILGKVKSGDITVEGRPFPEFYGQFIASFPLMHPTIRVFKAPVLSFPAPGPNGVSRVDFKRFFDDLSQWANTTELTIQEFVAIFLIVANETGGSFRPVAEKGSLSYMFYLNKSPNRKAGDQLRDRGVITDPELIEKWNAVGILKGGSCINYPGTLEAGPTDADVTECDFNKYRGHGYVQLTFKHLHERYLDPALLAAGLPKGEDMTSAELDDAVLNNDQVAYGTLSRYLRDARGSWSLTNSEQWRQWGLRVAGQNNPGYGDIVQFRAENLFARLVQAARAGQVDLK